MFNKIKDILVNDKELDFSWQRLLSLIFLCVAGYMCSLSYIAKDWIFDDELTFYPRFLSAIIGISLIAPLYFRKILKWNKSIYSIISFMLILLLFSSFVELAMGGNEKSNWMYAMISIAVILSWLGIRGIAGICWIIVAIAAVVCVILNNYILGFNGFIYICSGFLGLLLHTGLNPGELVKSIKDEYADTTNNAKKEIKTQIKETGQIGAQLAGNIL